MTNSSKLPNLAEAGISDDQLLKFAESCSMTGVDMPEFVTILGAYCGRKALRVDLWDGTFFDAPSTTFETSVVARAQERRINELTELTAVLQWKDDELQKARVPQPPPLNAKNVNDLAASQHGFHWMNTLASALQGLQQVPLNAEDWTQDVFVQKVWCLLHIELPPRSPSSQTSRKVRLPQPRGLMYQWRLSLQMRRLIPRPWPHLRPVNRCRVPAGALSAERMGTGQLTARWLWHKATFCAVMARSFG